MKTKRNIHPVDQNELNNITFVLQKLQYEKKLFNVQRIMRKEKVNCEQA